MVIKECRISVCQLKGTLIAFITFFCVSHNAFINSHAGFVSTIQHAVNLLMFLVLGLLCVMRITKLKKTTIVAMLMLGEILIMTFLTGRDFPTGVAQLSPMLTVCFSLEIASRNERSFLSYIDALKHLFLLVVLIDLATQILYPHGLYKTESYDINWFLGYKTERLSYSLPMILLYMYSSYRKTGKISKFSYVISLLALVNAYLSQGTAGTLVVLFFILFSLAFDYQRLNSSKLIAACLNPKVVIIVYALILYTMLFISETKWIQSILLQLGKSPDFSGRGTIWKVCLELFKKSPVFGWGHLVSDEYRALAHFKQASNAHNSVITLIVEGGIICLAMYIFILFCVLTRHRDYTAIEKRIAIFIYLILMIGLTSSIIIFSSFTFLAFWLMENEGRLNMSEKIGRWINMLMHKKGSFAK